MHNSSFLLQLRLGTPRVFALRTRQRDAIHVQDADWYKEHRRRGRLEGARQRRLSAIGLAHWDVLMSN